jgi:hypothetical protein
MKLKDLFGKKTKTNLEKVVIKIDKKQLEKITGGASIGKSNASIKMGGSDAR